MELKKLPNPPKSFINLLGPGIVLVAMGLGSGEYVLWPYLISQFGFGIIWGAVLGILFQYFVSNETGRYTLITGNSVFIGFYKLSRIFPIWFIISTFLSFGWPGIIGTGGEILGKLLGVEEHKWLTIAMLLLIGVIFTVGGKVYSTLENTQKIILAISIPAIFVIAVTVLNPGTVTEMLKGIVGIGNGFLFFPAGIAIGQFLSAIAYSGAGGNLILSHSFYIQDEGSGMARYSEGQVVKGEESYHKELSYKFEMTEDNIKRFKKWFREIALEQFVSFVLIGLFTIFLLAIVAYELVYPVSAKNDISFLFLEAERLAQIGPYLGTLLLIVGVVFLFKTQLGVFESTSRIMAENLHIGFKRFKNANRSKVFFGFLWAQIIFAITITFLEIAAPLQILFINALFSALSMFVLSGSILWLNRSNLIPKELKPGLFRMIIIFVSFIFFGIFSFVAIAEYL